jgi:hypothetical protein
VNHSTMAGPGMHEDAARDALALDNVAEAQVRALLAIASAINRLADAQEALAEAQR